jgi:nucleotide-binding universal stress UspA family protein
MAKRILVPLDRTPPPAELLDLVNDAARGGGADGRVMAYANQESARLEAEAMARLRIVELHFGGVPTESVVRFGNTADEIVAEAEQFGADLIAMPARGRSGVSRLIFGTVAEQVARRAPMSVVLVRRSMPAW